MNDLHQEFPAAVPAEPVSVAEASEAAPDPKPSSAADNPEENEVKQQAKVKAARVKKAEQLFALKLVPATLPLVELVCEGVNRKKRNPKKLEWLTASVKNLGVLEPLIVRRMAKTKQYRVIAGEGRHKAATMAGLSAVPCLVVEGPLTRAAEMWIVHDENQCHEEMSAFEQALIMKALEEEGFTQTQIAEHMKRSQPLVSEYLSFFEKSEEVQKQVEAGTLTFKQAVRAKKESTTAAVPGDGQEKPQDSKCPEVEPHRWNDADTKIQIRVHSRSKKLNNSNLIRAVKRWLKALETAEAATGKF